MIEFTCYFTKKMMTYWFQIPAICFSLIFELSSHAVAKFQWSLGTGIKMMNLIGRRGKRGIDSLGLERGICGERKYKLRWKSLLCAGVAFTYTLSQNWNIWLNLIHSKENIYQIISRSYTFSVFSANLSSQWGAGECTSASSLYLR